MTQQKGSSTHILTFMLDIHDTCILKYHPLDGRPLGVQSSDEQQASRINDTIKARDKQIDRQSGEIDTYIQRH